MAEKRDNVISSVPLGTAAKTLPALPLLKKLPQPLHSPPSPWDRVPSVRPCPPVNTEQQISEQQQKIHVSILERAQWSPSSVRQQNTHSLFSGRTGARKDKKNITGHQQGTQTFLQAPRPHSSSAQERSGWALQRRTVSKATAQHGPRILCPLPFHGVLEGDHRKQKLSLHSTPTGSKGKRLESFREKKMLHAKNFQRQVQLPKNDQEFSRSYSQPLSADMDFSFLSAAAGNNTPSFSTFLMAVEEVAV
ncbi:uncharacterized protein LOC113950426 [Corapipo altera]|uniref:uncharacterized protein LOC113950426 n=1 Tax=Corapipo altera TaxID=415028 RepID=UPI000FD641C4|nr:uncharacterized protein LOC113950426 [Corapipo altera]